MRLRLRRRRPAAVTEAVQAIHDTNATIYGYAAGSASREEALRAIDAGLAAAGRAIEALERQRRT